MKQHDITKICADSLRSFLEEKHGIRLGSSHAHELVAAFFGYQSRAAMLADIKCPINDLENAEFILLNPPIALVDQRLKNLEGLSPNLPASIVLAEGFYAPLVANKKLLGKIWPTSLSDLAISVAEERIQQHIGHWKMNPAPQWLTDVKIVTAETEIRMLVTFDSLTNTGGRSSYAKIEVKLTRIAGNLGYGNLEVMPTFYSGQMRDSDFRLKHGIA